MMLREENTEKKNRITRIQLPYFFIPLACKYGNYRVLCGKCRPNGGFAWYERYSCNDAGELIEMLDRFEKYCKAKGDMRPAITDGIHTNCLSKMITDDGYSELQPLIDEPDDMYEPFCYPWHRLEADGDGESSTTFPPPYARDRR